MTGYSNFDPFATGTLVNTDWSGSRLLTDRKAYDRAMRPITREAEWRNRNFYRASEWDRQYKNDVYYAFGSGDAPPAEVPPSETSTVPPDGIFQKVGGAGTELKDFIMPGGKVDVYRAGVVVGLIALSAFVVGTLVQKR